MEDQEAILKEKYHRIIFIGKDSCLHYIVKVYKTVCTL